MRRAVYYQRNVIGLLACLFLLPGFATADPAPKFLKKSSILRTMTLANDYFMRA